MTGRRVTRGEVLAAAGGAVLLAAMFSDWFSVEIAAGRVRGAADIARQAGDTNAWQAFDFVDIVLLLAAGLALAQAIGRLTGGLPALPLRAGTGVALVGGLALALAVAGIADPPGEEGRFVGGLVVDTGTEPGAWLGLAACAAIIAGGLLAARERGPEPASAARSALAGPASF